MRRSSLTLAMTFLLFVGIANAQEVVDRIAARIENDIILLSQVHELGRYQQMVEGRTESDQAILDRLIDQWVVRTEAEASRYPVPTAQDIDKGVERLQRSIGSAEQFAQEKNKNGLNHEEIRRLVAAQLYLGNYLDSRFRPSVQVDSPAIEEFYKSAVVPRAKAKGEIPPTLEASHDVIQEALTQKAINDQASQWLRESRSRIHVENMLRQGAQ